MEQNFKKDTKTLDSTELITLISKTEQEINKRIENGEFDIWDDNDESGVVDDKVYLEKLKREALARKLISEKQFYSTQTPNFTK